MSSAPKTFSLRSDEIAVSAPAQGRPAPNRAGREPAITSHNTAVCYRESRELAIQYIPVAMTGYRPVMAFQRHLLDDHVRTGAFIEAIERAVQPGDVVADVGSGTGILAMAACRAGAGRVYALEQEPFIHAARESARRSGFDASRLTFIHGDANQVRRPQKVDVVVSECLGLFGPSGMMLTVANVAQRWLKPTGKVIPRAISTFIVPVESPFHFDYVHVWDQQPRYGFDFSPFQQTASNNVYVAWFQESTFLAEPQQIAVRRLRHDDTGRIRAEVVFTAVRDGSLHGFGGWFEADLGAGVILSAAPTAEPTIWQQSYLPLAQAIPVRVGQSIQLRFELNVGHEPAFRWDTSAAGTTLQQSTQMSAPTPPLE